MIIRKRNSLTWKIIVFLWLLVLTICLGLTLTHLINHGLRYDLNTAEPDIVYDDVVTQASNRLSYLNDYRTIFMVGFPVEQSSDFESYVARINAKWIPPSTMKHVQWEGLDINDTLSYFRTISKSLMSMRDQIDTAKETDAELFARAIESLTTIGNNGYIAKTDDPLGFFTRWVQKRVPKSTILTTGDTLKLYADGYVWAISFYQAPQNDSINPIAFMQSVQQLKKVVKEIEPNALVMVRGKVYESSVIATQNIEDLVAVFIVLFCFFGFICRQWTKSNVFPLFIIGCTLAGIILGTYACLLFFNYLNLWTLTLSICFLGISFINIVYLSFIHHQHPNINNKACLKIALPSLFWMTFVECIALAVLWFVPIAIWKQFSLFMTVAIIATTLTAIIVYPLISYNNNYREVQSEKLDFYNRYWPRLSLKRWQKRPVDILGYSIILFFIAFSGFYLLEYDLNNENVVELPLSVQLQRSRVDDMLMLPSFTQFYLVTSASTQETLMNEEALRMGFVQRRFSNMTTTCVSKWFPSNERAQLVKKIRVELFERIKKPINQLIGYEIQHNIDAQNNVDFDHWYASLSSTQVRHLWLGEHKGKVSSIVLIAGITEPIIPQLKKLAEALSGVEFIDKLDLRKQVLNNNRFFMSGVFVLLVVSSLTLSLFHYGLNSWRIVFPPLIGSLGAIAVLSWFKVPFSLISVLGMIIVYGIGMAISLTYQSNQTYGSKSLILLFYSLIVSIVSFSLIGLIEAPFTETFSMVTTVGILLTCCSTFLFRENRYSNLR